MTIPVWNRTIVNDMGDIQPGSEVEVIIESTGLPATLYSNRAGTTALTNPFFADGNGFAQFYAAPNEYRITATATSGSIVWRYESMIQVQSSLTDTTTDRLMKVGAFGQGKTGGNDYIADLDDLKIGGKWAGAFTTTTGGIPPQVAGGTKTYSIDVNVRNSSFLSQTFMVNRNESGDGGRTFIRYFDIAFGWSSWQELYHSGNTNLNEFGGVAAGDVIATGVALSIGTIKLYMPLSGVTAPTGITITGTFSFRRINGDSLAVGGVTAISFNSTTSNKMLVLSFSPAAGLVAGETYEVRTDTAASKITVNY